MYKTSVDSVYSCSVDIECRCITVVFGLLLRHIEHLLLLLQIKSDLAGALIVKQQQEMEASCTIRSVDQFKMFQGNSRSRNTYGELRHHTTLWSNIQNATIPCCVVALYRHGKIASD